MARPRSFNRRYIINNKLQITLILYSVSLTVAVTALNLFFEWKFGAEFQNPDSTQIKYIFAIATCSLFFLSTLLGFWITNKIAGPIYRLRIHIDKIAQGGKAEPMTFRKGDYFSEIIEPYNKVLKRLKSHE